MSTFFGYVFAIVCVAAWFTHLFTCLGAGLWGFLMAGALFFPIGIIHGFGIIIGIF